MGNKNKYINKSHHLLMNILSIQSKFDQQTIMDMLLDYLLQKLSLTGPSIGETITLRAKDDSINHDSIFYIGYITQVEVLDDVTIFGLSHLIEAESELSKFNYTDMALTLPKFSSRIKLIKNFFTDYEVIFKPSKDDCLKIHDGFLSFEIGKEKNVNT